MSKTDDQFKAHLKAKVQSSEPDEVLRWCIVNGVPADWLKAHKSVLDRLADRKATLDEDRYAAYIGDIARDRMPLMNKYVALTEGGKK